MKVGTGVEGFIWIDMFCIYPIRSRFSCHRFWRHRPPKRRCLSQLFLRNRRIFSPLTSRVICKILVSKILTAEYKKRGLPKQPTKLEHSFPHCSSPRLAIFFPSWNEAKLIALPHILIYFSTFLPHLPFFLLIEVS